jgi:hypothetical protein
MNTKAADISNHPPKGNISSDEELVELIRRSSKEMPSLVEQIKDCQRYCSNIEAFVAEAAVKEDWTNG